MAKALRLMTFNTQQLPWLARKIGTDPVFGSPGAAGPTDLEVKERAKRVSRAILDMPNREQPDIISFNEVFSATGRKWLIHNLEKLYPHFTPVLEHPGLDVEEDSGLLLMSKLPFEPLPVVGGIVHFEVFSATAGTDSLSSKGVGVVRVNGPVNPVTIAFTHLQASSDEENTEHASIRSKQLDHIQEVLRKIADGHSQNYTNSIIVGDLNIKGDPDDKSGEWNNVFGSPLAQFGKDFNDAWRMYMHAPDDMTDHDPGYTHRDTVTGQLNRFDYCCLSRDLNVDIGLVTQHMKTPIRLESGITDHWALLSHIHKISPNSTPSMALNLLVMDADNKGQPSSPIWVRATDFRDEDMFHWVYIKDAGTYTVFCSTNLEVSAYRRNDFTHDLKAVDILTTSQLPAPVSGVLNWKKRVRVFEKGETFSCRDPFFLRFRGVSTSFKGAAPYAILRHRGESRETAIFLEPHKWTDAGFPQAQKLGLNDQCFFRINRPDVFSQQAYTDTFITDNPQLSQISVALQDEIGNPIDLAYTDTRPKMDRQRKGTAELIYLVVTRTDVSIMSLRCYWDSPVTYLSLDNSLRLHIDDETGPDWPGADEFELAVDIDGVNVYLDSWDDADAGEDWPGLADSIKASVNGKTPGFNSVAFMDSIYFDVIKTDGIFAHGSTGGIIGKLLITDAEVETRLSSFLVIDPIGDGKLTAYATLSRFPLF